MGHRLEALATMLGVLGLVIVWASGIQSATVLVVEDQPKSSLILNESFIQMKIRQRYHPAGSIKNPQVSVKLSGDSGMLTPASISTLPPFSTTTPKVTETTKNVHNEFGFSAAPSSKLHLYAEKLTLGGSLSGYVSLTSSTEPSVLPAIIETSGSQEEGYGTAEVSDEELRGQQSQYNQKPWLQQTNNGFNSLSKNHYYDHDYESHVSEEQYPTGDGGSYEYDSYVTTTALSTPLKTTLTANRRVGTEAKEFNGIQLSPLVYNLGGRSSHELENMATADDDQISRYFLKTKPKQSLSVSVSPIIDYTSTTPFTVLGAPTLPPVLTTTPRGNLTGLQFHAASFIVSADQALLDDRQQQVPSSGSYPVFGYTTPGSGSSEMPKDFNNAGHENTNDYSSTAPVTSTNSLQAELGDMPNLFVSPLVSALTTSEATITPSTSTSTATDATSIPGIPGVDYPILGEIPFTGFDCKNQRYKGFFADVKTKCQAWHYCDFTDGHSTFLCPNGTLFSQVLLTCDWWFNVDCSQAQQLYVLNERLYRYIKPPKPSFPEDFHGPQVDLWLVQQLQLGLLPKMKKKVKDKVVINN